MPLPRSQSSMAVRFISPLVWSTYRALHEVEEALNVGVGCLQQHPPVCMFVLRFWLINIYTCICFCISPLLIYFHPHFFGVTQYIYSALSLSTCLCLYFYTYLYCTCIFLGWPSALVYILNVFVWIFVFVFVWCDLVLCICEVGICSTPLSTCRLGWTAHILSLNPFS